ncbi:AAA family ATPase [Amycolatopsis aidingensis]|uniref:AAA family ATPase n=1 Tax=Amycolatopsis aidingensis TaxID=2842453 RepID=UPI001C0CE48A|nr:LuxR family transcriptional regulator [Amycolatopsis aidingensis]
MDVDFRGFLLERDHELAWAAGALDAAAAGTGGVVVIGGPPGAGRSALLDALAGAEQAAPFLPLRANGSAAEADHPLGLARQLLRPVLGTDQRPEPEGWPRGAAGHARRLLAAVPGTMTDARREVLLHGLHVLIGELGRDRPVLLLADDLQWADPPSLRWLGYLARRIVRMPILIACTIAEDCASTDPALLRELAATASRTLRPGPLSPPSVHRMAERVLGGACSEDLVLTCLRATGGNPGALVAVLSGLRDRHPRPARRWADVPAETVQVLLRDWRMACLAVQPEPVRALAGAVAVLDTDAGPELLRDLTGMTREEYKSAIQAMDRTGLLAGTGAPRLAHSTVRAAVMAELSAEATGRLHAGAARLLHEAGYPAERVAAHVLAAGGGQGPTERKVLRRAAGAALDRGAPGEAVRYLRAALAEESLTGLSRARLLVDLAVAGRGLDLATAARDLVSAVPRLGSAAERAAAALWLPPAFAATDPAAGALLRRVAGEQGVDRTGIGPPGRADSCGPSEAGWRLEARLRWLAIQEPAPPSECATRLRWLRDQEPVLADGGGRELLTVLAYRALLTGTLPAAELADVLDRVLEREPANAAHTYTALPALAHLAAGTDSVTALSGWLDLAAIAVAQQESAGARAVVNAERAVLLAGTGHLAGARDLAEGVLDGADPAWPEATTLAVLALATVALRTMDPEPGPRIRLAVRHSGDLRAITADRMVRGMADLVRGDPRAALDRFLDCGRQLACYQWAGPAFSWWRCWAAAAQQRLGDSAAALALADAQYQAALAWGSPMAVGQALRLRGTLTEGAAGIELLREAVTVLRASADQIELGAAILTLGRRLDATAAPGAARLLAESDRIAADRGARWLEPARPGAVTFPVPRITPAGRGALTGTEDAVVELVLRGWSNQRVADDLGVTRRAVEKNLTRVYRKLGVSGRAGLIGRLGAG